MLVVGRIITESALMRNESRGTHYRADCKAIDDPAWLRQIVIKDDGGEMNLSTYPIELPPELQHLKRSLEGIS